MSPKKKAGLSRLSACPNSEGIPMKVGIGRMHKLVWFSHEKDQSMKSFDLWALIPYPSDH